MKIINDSSEMFAYQSLDESYGEPKAPFYSALLKENRYQAIGILKSHRKIELSKQQAESFYEDVLSQRDFFQMMDGKFLYIGKIEVEIEPFQESFLLQQANLKDGYQRMFLLLAPYLALMKTTSNDAVFKQVEERFFTKKLMKPLFFLDENDFKLRLQEDDMKDLISYFHQEDLVNQNMNDVLQQAEYFLKKIQEAGLNDTQVLAYLDRVLATSYAHVDLKQ